MIIWSNDELWSELRFYMQLLFYRYEWKDFSSVYKLNKCFFKFFFLQDFIRSNTCLFIRRVKNCVKVGLFFHLCALSHLPCMWVAASDRHTPLSWVIFFLPGWATALHKQYNTSPQLSWWRPAMLRLWSLWTLLLLVSTSPHILLKVSPFSFQKGSDCFVSVSLSLSLFSPLLYLLATGPLTMLPHC